MRGRDRRGKNKAPPSTRRILTEILKTEIGFKGFVATDWNAATDSGGGVVNSVNAGVDMLMQPADWKGTLDVIAAGVADARMNDAVSRILAVKCAAGRFTRERAPPQRATPRARGRTVRAP